MLKYENRQADYPIDSLLLSRVSSRAFSQERLSDEELLSLFEAAHWSPSSFNAQPWRFVYSRRGDDRWSIFFESLIDFNKSWCEQADTLVVVISRQFFEHDQKINPTASFDAGAAWMGLAIEANSRNLIAHAMSGFDHEKLKKDLNVSDVFKVEAMIAIGKKGNKDHLSEELKKKELPSLRKPLQDIIKKGVFNFK
jgi:nitroreductase